MKGEEIKKLVAKRENAAVEFKRAKGITAAQAGLANRASQAERKRVPSRREKCRKFQMDDTLQRKAHMRLPLFVFP